MSTLSAGMDADSFHRRLLPKALIALFGTEGRRLVREALLAGDLEGYFPLAESFHTQADPAFCALATLVIVLNALDIDSERHWRTYGKELLCCCRSSAVGLNTSTEIGSSDFSLTWAGGRCYFPHGIVGTGRSWAGENQSKLTTPQRSDLLSSRRQAMAAAHQNAPRGPRPPVDRSVRCRCHGAESGFGGRTLGGAKIRAEQAATRDGPCDGARPHLAPASPRSRGGL